MANNEMFISAVAYLARLQSGRGLATERHDAPSEQRLASMASLAGAEATHRLADALEELNRLKRIELKAAGIPTETEARQEVGQSVSGRGGVANQWDRTPASGYDIPASGGDVV